MWAGGSGPVVSTNWASSEGAPGAAGDVGLTLTLFPDRSKVPWNTGLRVMTSSG